MVQTIDIEQMRDRLLTLDQVRDRLAATENLSQHEFVTDGADNVQFSFPDGWNADLKDAEPLDITNASVRIHGVERRLTKEAALEALSTFGVQNSLALSTPGPLTELIANYHYNNSDKALKMLASPETGLAFTRATVEPFSNTAILDAVLSAVESKYGTNDVLADYKFHHDLRNTHLRIIVPSHQRNIGSARAEAANDPWSVGIDIRNSVIGASSLELKGYLFAWWCTNGCTSTHATSGKYRRKPTVDVTDAYDWARTVVDEVLGGLEGELDAVEALTRVPLEGELNETLAAMFERFRVPVRSRELVIENLVESDDLSAYGLMNAITGAANNGELSPAAVSSLLQAGGGMAHAIGNPTCENPSHRFLD